MPGNVLFRFPDETDVLVMLVRYLDKAVGYRPGRSRKELVDKTSPGAGAGFDVFGYDVLHWFPLLVNRLFFY